MTCPSELDEAFGPFVDAACRSFDLTLKFEDVVLTCIPSSIFLTLVFCNTFELFRRPCDVSARITKSLAFETTILAAFGTTQLILLALRLKSNHFRTSASLAADLLGLAAAGLVLIITFINHQRSLQPPSLATIYLSSYTLFGIARAHTAWLMDRTAALVIIASLTLSLLEVVLQSISILDQDPEEQLQRSPEEDCGFWNRATLSWLIPTLRLGYVKDLTVDDLPLVDHEMGSARTSHKLLAAWNKYDRQSRHSLLRACLRAHSSSLLLPIFPRLCLSAFSFVQPFLLRSTMSLVDRSHPQMEYGQGLVAAWLLVLLGIAVGTTLFTKTRHVPLTSRVQASSSIFQYHSNRFVAALRGSLLGLVYRSSLQIRICDQGNVTAMAILGPDITQIVSGVQCLHQSWSALLDVAIGTWLLQRQLSWACTAPIMVVLALIGVISKISNTTNVRQREWIEKVQERLEMTTEVLGNLKTIKMLGLSSTLSTLVQDVRRYEIRSSSSYRRVLLGVIVISNLPAILVPMATFVIYAFISTYWTGTSLDVQQAFSSLALISLFTTPVMTFTQTLPRMIQAFGCFSRVQEYCNYDRSISEAEPATEAISSSESSRGIDASMKLKSAAYRWTPDGPIILKNPNIEIQPGTIVAVVGSVGSGKTTLLASLLGETIGISAESGKRRARVVAYCSQHPWLENQTIRNNIIGELDYDPGWYKTVLNACELEPNVASQVAGDMTLVGSKGVGLSGGQIQRIALARAIYHRSSVVLLDDIFSGMDAHTIDTVSRRLLGTDGLLRLHGITVVLVAVNRKVVALADRVIALASGELVEVDHPGKLLNDDDCISRLGLSISNNIPEQAPQAQSDAKKPAVQSPQREQGPAGDERRRKGDISAYTYYLRNGGIPAFVGSLVSRTATVILTYFSTIWLKWWSEADASSHNKGVGMYLGVYILLGMSSVLCTFLSGWFLFIHLISRSSDRLHLHLLEATLRAPFWVLRATDVGNLMNRFSQDMEIVDLALPGSVYNVISTVLACLSRLVMLLFFSPYLGLVLPFFATAIYFLQRLYLRTALQVRLLSIEAKAPLFTSFIDSVAGASTIRAFGWQPNYQRRTYRLIDRYQRPEYMQNCLLYWLTFVLDVVLAIFAALLVAAIVGRPASFAEGSVGVSLLMLIGFSRTVTSVGTTWSTMEASMGAVLRVKTFTEETPKETESRDSDPTWLKSGRISFKDLEVAHCPEGNSVLRNISLSVEPKQHIAICGRTGSGKTSLLLTILHMTIIKKGNIIIDGKDIEALSPEQLRRAINVVPQDPFIIPHTSIRANADPFGHASDDEIERALRRVGLWGYIVANGGLDEMMDASEWSAGQKQLFCLARAMTRKSEIVLLDEAMSFVDAESEAVMQDIIDTEFQDVTVLANIHRLKHVHKYDKVVLLDGGELVEFDTPRALLSQEGSEFAALYNASEK